MIQTQRVLPREAATPSGEGSGGDRESREAV